MPTPRRFVALAALLALAAPLTPPLRADAPPAPTRFDPYKTYKFRLVMAGATVAGFTTQTPVMVTYASRGHAYISLATGMTEDAAFAAWAAKTAKAGSGAGELRSLRLALYDTKSDAQTAAHAFRRCWASAYQFLPVLNAKGPGVPIQSIMLECAAPRP